MDLQVKERMDSKQRLWLARTRVPLRSLEFLSLDMGSAFLVREVRDWLLCLLCGALTCLLIRAGARGILDVICSAVGVTACISILRVFVDMCAGRLCFAARARHAARDGGHPAAARIVAHLGTTAQSQPLPQSAKVRTCCRCSPPGI